VAQKFHRRLTENTFFPVNDKAEKTQPLEQGLQVLQVLLQGVAGDDDVIKVSKRESQLGQHSVHHALKRVPCVPQAEGKAAKLEKPEGGRHGRLWNVSRVH
jgi:hypothetical protein